MRERQKKEKKLGSQRSFQRQSVSKIVVFLEALNLVMYVYIGFSEASKKKSQKREG